MIFFIETILEYSKLDTFYVFNLLFNLNPYYSSERFSISKFAIQKHYFLQRLTLNQMQFPILLNILLIIRELLSHYDTIILFICCKFYNNSLWTIFPIACTKKVFVIEEINFLQHLCRTATCKCSNRACTMHIHKY